jgi:enoyl-[acyl-carrier protein] reductase II
MIGSNPGWVPAEQRKENLRHHIRTAKALTSKPFGVNFTLFTLRDVAEQQMDVAIEEGVKVAVSSGGNPRLFTRKLKDAGLLVMQVVGNQRQAKTAEEAGVDIIIAEGYEAGGNNFPDELTTMVLIPYIVDAVNVPVVAAGGIADSRAFMAALALGAQAVQMGTAFIPTKECHVHQAYKEAIVASQDTDTVITQRAIGTRIRGLKNPHSLKVLELDQQGAAEELRAFLGLGKAREGQMEGDIENGELQIGQVAGSVTEIKEAGDVVRDIIGGASAVIERCRRIQSQEEEGVC